MATFLTPTARRILLIDDDAELAQMLREYLEPAHFQLALAHTCEQGLHLASQQDFDLLLLDLMLPDGNGLDLLKQYRQRSRRPVIMFTAHGGETDRVLGLEFGADDYLTKPFAIQELEARLRALIRRERRQVGAEVLKVADLVLDPVSMRATRAGTELQLSPIGLRLLTILMRESPRVVTRQEIEREIWGNGLPDSDTLRSHLYNLRKIIDKPFDRPLLHTVQSAGYRIAAIAQPMG